MKVVGECFHMINGFLCTEGKHQNYPCPYGDKANQCSCFIPITREMVEQWEEHGCIHIPVKEGKEMKTKASYTELLNDIYDKVESDANIPKWRRNELLEMLSRLIAKLCRY